MMLCGPYICEFPDPALYNWAERWTCPVCGTRYRMAREVKPRWWRNWSAPRGRWVIDRWR